MEWRNKTIPTAHYTSAIPASFTTNTLGLITCLEVITNACTDVPQMNLPVGYFTSTCAVASGDCVDFIQALYSLGFMGAVSNSATADEPTGSRSSQLSGIGEQTSIYPAGYYDNALTFVIP